MKKFNIRKEIISEKGKQWKGDFLIILLYFYQPKLVFFMFL